MESLSPLTVTYEEVTLTLPTSVPKLTALPPADADTQDLDVVWGSMADEIQALLKELEDLSRELQSRSEDTIPPPPPLPTWEPSTPTVVTASPVVFPKAMHAELTTVLRKHSQKQYLRSLDVASLQVERNLSLEQHRQRVLQEPWPGIFHTIRTQSYRLKPASERTQRTPVSDVAATTPAPVVVPSQGRCTIL